jgi:hypothetical protein
MRQIVTMVALGACIIGLPGPSAADPVHGSVSAHTGSSTDTRPLKASTLETMAEHSSQTCLRNLSVCLPDGRLDTRLSLTDQTTLIGHLTLAEYAALAEVSAVIEMYLTAGALTVRFLGGAWPGSALSVFETSFPL